MNQPSSPLRRNLLASLPGILLAPAALAQQGLQTPRTTPKITSTSHRDVPILPFALAGAWSDDYGARSILKMTPDLSGSIVFSEQAPPYEEDQLRLLKIQVGAAMECISTLASASSCGYASFFPKLGEDAWIAKISIRVSPNGGPANPRAVTSCGGIWARPNAGGGFDPAWNDKRVIEAVAGLMQEYGVAVNLLQGANASACAEALQAIAKASPALAKKIGPASNWGPGATPVLLGIKTQEDTQGFLSTGQSLQRGSLQAFAEGANCDSIVLPPKALEAAAVASKEAATAVKTLVKFLEGQSGEPIAVARIGKLANPVWNSMPACVPMIAFA